jgi:hypothetical protein
VGPLELLNPNSACVHNVHLSLPLDH